MLGVLLMLGLVACGPGSDDSASPTTDTSTTTPVLTGPGVLCSSKKASALQVICQVELASPGPVDLTLFDLDGSTRVFSSEGQTDVHELVLWRLRAETEYRVQVSSRSGDEVFDGTFTTDSLPDNARFRTTVTGQPSFDYVLSNHKCNGAPVAYLMDPEGEMVWYEDVTATVEGLVSGGIEGLLVTDNGVMVVVGRTLLREFSWQGELLFEARYPEDFAFPIHHDVVRKNGLIYVLFAEQVTGADGAEYVLDGVFVLNEQGAEVGRIRLADHIVPTDGEGTFGGYWSAYYPVAYDYTHANGLYLDDDGGLLVSLRHQNTLLKFAADPNEADFGTLLWRSSADPTGAFGNDFSFANTSDLPDANFQAQHNPNRDALGNLLLFDNRDAVLEPSRATVWQVDEVARSFTLTEAWQLPAHCLFQGSAMPLENGRVLATCPSNMTVYEFAPGTPEPVYEMEIPCSFAAGTLMARGIPVSF